MPVESPPESGAISFVSWATTLSTFSSESATFAAENIVNPQRSKRARATSNGSTEETYVLDLGSAKLPTFFSTVDANFARTGNTVRIIGADNAALTTNAVYWNAPMWNAVKGDQLAADEEADFGNGVWTFYPGDPTSGTAAAKRYWGLRMSTTINGGAYDLGDMSVLEIGRFWVGQYTALEVSEDFRWGLASRSISEEAIGGADYVDPIEDYSDRIRVPLELLTHAAFYSIKAKAKRVQGRPIILDAHAGFTDLTVRAGGAFYAKFAGRHGLSGVVRGPLTDSLDLDLQELS